MDISVFNSRISTIFIERNLDHRLLHASILIHRRIDIFNNLRYFYHVFPYTYRTKKHTSNSCEHVLLCPTHNRHCYKHIHWDGLPQLAKNCSSDNRLCRRCACKFQSRSKIYFNNKITFYIIELISVFLCFYC